MIAPARRAAYAVLRAVSDRTLDLPAALARARDPLRDPRDRALAGEIAIGTLRWLGALDAIVTDVTGRAAHQLDPEVLDILRVSVYQLWHLERVPAAAVVNDAVELTRVARRGRASGLVNAALRRLGRGNIESRLPPRPGPEATRDERLDYLSVTLSHPRWIAARWLDRLGFEPAEAWMRFNNSAAPLTLRVNELQTNVAALQDALARHGVAATRARHAPGALTVQSGNPLATPLAAEGMFLVQDEASQLVAHMAAVRAGERVFDACASPGGKTVVMANTGGGRAAIVAADVRDRRVALLAQMLRRAGLKVPLLQADLRDGVPLAPVFDCVLVDAPCSGLGTVRRDPDIKWRRAEADLEPLAATERLLLGHAARAVRDGGRLVYATCSSEPEENEGVVEAFLAASPAFAPASPDRLAAGASWPALAPLCDRRGWLRTRPDRDGLEAFFAAVLVKAQPV
jgi:16S rRNA (cytosine967-C5)-methyltransferase